MLAAALREKIEIWKQEEVRKSYGVMEKVDVKITDAYAEVKQKTNTNNVDQDRIVYTEEIEVVMRNYPKINMSNFLLYNNNRYYVKSVNEFIDRSGQKILAAASVN